jgi:hypothetical protein
MLEVDDLDQYSLRHDWQVNYLPRIQFPKKARRLMPWLAFASWGMGLSLQIDADYPLLRFERCFFDLFPFSSFLERLLWGFSLLKRLLKRVEELKRVGACWSVLEHVGALERWSVLESWSVGVLERWSVGACWSVMEFVGASVGASIFLRSSPGSARR